MKSSKIIKNTIFVQDCGQYSSEILVIVGISDKKQIFKFLKKIKANFNFSKWVLSDFSEWAESISKKNKGLFCFNEDVNGAVLVLREVEDSWKYWEVLMHEVHHAVLRIATQKSFLEENENQAYLFEYLFRSIRRKLQGVDKIV